MSAIHLASEIIESQKVRSDLLKWKIIAVAVIASIGFGISSSHNKFELAFCIIPFVMAYIDSLCIHINLRIFSIAKWHATEKAKELESDADFIYMREYEKYTNKAWAVGVFNLEKWTIFFSSAAINLALIAAPAFDLENKIFQFSNYIMICGIIGLVITIALNVYLYKTKRKVNKIEHPNKTTQNGPPPSSSATVR